MASLKSSLLGLPTELRLTIYELTFGDEKTVTLCINIKATTSKSIEFLQHTRDRASNAAAVHDFTSLAATCKQTRDDALPTARINLRLKIISKACFYTGTFRGSTIPTTSFEQLLPHVTTMTVEHLPYGIVPKEGQFQHSYRFEPDLVIYHFSNRSIDRRDVMLRRVVVEFTSLEGRKTGRVRSARLGLWNCLHLRPFEDTPDPDSVDEVLRQAASTGKLDKTIIFDVMQRLLQWR